VLLSVAENELRENILLDFDECPKEALLLSSAVNAWNAHRVDLSHSPDICTLLPVVTQHFLANLMEIHDNC